MTVSSNRVFIFDTTLRDGEQSPGCSMTVTEKVRLAHKLEELGVDILEAGFPIASEGDFEAVRAVSREVKTRVAALARSTPLDIERAAAALEQAVTAAPHSHVHRDQRHSPEVQAEKIAPGGSGRGRRGDQAGAQVRGGRRVLGGGRRANGSRVPGSDRARGRRRGRQHGQHSGHRRLFDPRRVRRHHSPRRRGAGGRGIVSVHCHDDLGLSVANSLAAVQAGRARSNAPSTASVSAPATVRWKRS